MLNALARTERVPIYGIDYKDKEDAARAWLAELGNPYTGIGADDGRVGIDWGVYGVPETFLVDKGRPHPLQACRAADPGRYRPTILPLVARLEKSVVYKVSIPAKRRGRMLRTAMRAPSGSRPRPGWGRWGSVAFLRSY